MSGHEDDVCSHVRVVVRVRPENEKEKEGNHRKVVHVVDKHLLVFDPKVEEVSFFHGKQKTNRDISKRKNKDLSFVFDAVFDENSTQLEVFENTTKIVLEGVLNGYNCTVLAYGATGSGKTHTMLGSPDAPGVMFLTMAELYKRIELIKDEKVCNVALSYLEVYNEQLRDLLGNSKPLALREDAQKGVVVQNLTLHQPKSAEEILKMLDCGNKNRTQHPTDMNATSSRSHAVFQIYLRQQDKAASINQNVRLAKMCLIDLAGSERASATNTKGARFREGANINRSLLALGNVINALADPKSKTQHIPYRNSKLTRLLKDSLGGNCRTIMIAAVSPSSFSYEDTYNTLKYANRAKDIKSAVKSNVVSLDSHISQYVKICEQQKKEIMMLKEKLCAYEEQKMYIPEERRQSLLLRSSQEKAEIQRFRELLKCLFVSREEIRKELLNLEMRQKENELKTSHQKQCHKQIHMICSAQKAVKATCKRDHRLAVLKTQHVHIQNKMEYEMKRFEENADWLHRVENEMRLSSQNGQMSEELSRDLQCCHLQLEVKDLNTQIQYMMYLVSLQEQENKHSEKLLNAVLPALRRQYQTLRDAGLSDATVETDFKEVEHLVRREKAVVWADETIVEETTQNCHPDISAVMAFSNLKCTPNTPCSAEKRKQSMQKRQRDTRNSKCALVKPFDGAPFEELKENVPVGILKGIIPPQKRTRRKLMESPLASENHEPSDPSCQHPDDSLSKELLPIVYTPDTFKKTTSKTTSLPDHLSQTVTKLVTPPSDFFQANNITCGSINIPLEVQYPTDISLNVTTGCQPTDMNSTVILHAGTGDTNYDSYGDLHLKQPQPCSSSVLQRLALPSLLNNHGKQIEKPSYMAMTSAAERKRKLLSSASCSLLKDDLPGPGTAKRVRQEASQTKVMRVRRAPGEIFGLKNEEQEAQKPLSRSISEGNLIPATKKRTFTFLKSHTFKRVAKK